jgi:hypothetical protein
MPEFITTIEFDDGQEFEVEVDYYVEEAQHGCHDSMGVPEEESWEAYVESINSVLCNGIDVWPDLDVNEKDEIFQKAEDHFNNRGE